MALNPTFAFVGGPCCLTLNFVFAILIMITFDTLTSLFCQEKANYVKSHFISSPEFNHGTFDIFLESIHPELKLKSVNA
jgi:hypothetical protein